MLIFQENADPTIPEFPKFVGKIKNTYYFYHQNKLYKADFSWLYELESKLQNENEEIEDILDMDKINSDFT